MDVLELIDIRIAECKACVEAEDSCFDEVALKVFDDMLQIREILDESVSVPHIQLDESVWCDYLDCNIDAVHIGTDKTIAMLASNRSGANVYQYNVFQIPRAVVLAVMFQIEKQINNNLKFKDNGEK